MMPGSDSRRGEVALLAAALAAILVATALASRMLIAAWDTHGLAYHLVHGFGRTMGWGIDGVVVFAALFGITLVVAFALDEDKHVQGVLLVAAIAFVFVPTLLVLGRWRIDFLAHPIPAVVGVLIGAFVVGIGASTPLSGDDRTAFPNAARALYAAVSLIAIVGLVERYLSYETPIVVVENTPTVDQIAGGPLTPLVDLVSVFALVYLMSYFTRYSDMTDVVISSPDEETVARFLGGLYGTAKDHRTYDATSLEGGDVLNRAGVRGEPITGRVAFEFRPGSGPFVRRREVSYDNIRPVTASDAEAMTEISDRRSSRSSRFWFSFRRHLLLAAPGAVRSQFRRSGGAHLDRLVNADVILLLAPLSDVIRESLIEEGGDFQDSWVQNKEYTGEWERGNSDGTGGGGIYDGIVSACSGSSMPDVYVVATDADLVLALRSEDSIDEGQFIQFLRTEVLRLGTDSVGQVIPVSDEDGEGYEKVLRSL